MPYSNTSGGSAGDTFPVETYDPGQQSDKERGDYWGRVLEPCAQMKLLKLSMFRLLLY